MTKRATLAIAVLLASLLPRAAAADDAAARAAAVQLFDDGDKLMQEGRYAEACPKLAQSNRLDPQIGVLLYLAECYEKNGQLASAWGSFREAEEKALKRNDERAAAAAQRAQALAPRLSRLVLRPLGDSAAPGLELSRDGMVVDKSLWGTAIAIDTGKHAVSASAPGYEPWSQEVDVVGEGTTLTVDVPTLKQRPKPAGASADTSIEGMPVPGGSQRIAAIAIGGVGIVGVGVGGFIGLSAQSTYSDSKQECNERNKCTNAGLELRSTAKDKALVATIASGVGVAALVTGAVLWFTAPQQSDKRGVRSSPRRVSVAPSQRGLGLDLSGEF